MKRLLIVEDNPEFAALAQHCFRDAYEVTVAKDAGVASAVMLADDVDGILLDVMLPGYSGLDFLDWMQGEPELRDIPVLMVTAANLQGSLRERAVRHPNVKGLLDKLKGMPQVIEAVGRAV